MEHSDSFCFSGWPRHIGSCELWTPDMARQHCVQVAIQFSEGTRPEPPTTAQRWCKEFAFPNGLMRFYLEISLNEAETHFKSIVVGTFFIVLWEKLPGFYKLSPRPQKASWLSCRHEPLQSSQSKPTQIKNYPYCQFKSLTIKRLQSVLKAECINVTFKDKLCQIQKMFKVTPPTVWMSTLGFVFTVWHFYLFGYWLAESCYSISATTKPSTRKVPSLDLAWRSSTLENRYWSVISLVFKWMLPPS